MSHNGVAGGNLSSVGGDEVGALRDGGSCWDLDLVRVRDFLDGLGDLAAVGQDSDDLLHVDDGLADFSWRRHGCEVRRGGAMGGEERGSEDQKCAGWSGGKECEKCRTARGRGICSLRGPPCVTEQSMQLMGCKSMECVQG